METNGTKLFFVVYLSTLLLACSSHPEIKPYAIQEENSAPLADEQRSLDLEIPENIADNDESKNEPLDVEDATLVETAAAEKEEVVVPQREQQKKPQRTVASVELKNGYYVFSSDCVMKSQPQESSKNVGTVNSGKKLWLDAHNGQWLKAYKKSGAAYVPASCVQ